MVIPRNSWSSAWENLYFSDESQDEKLCFSDMETNTFILFDRCFFDATTETWFEVKRVGFTGYTVQRRHSECACVIEVGIWRRKRYIHIKRKNEPHRPGQRVCIDRGCEESSVLAAGVISKAADVGLIDGVQEWAVSLKHTRKDHHTVFCVHARLFAHILCFSHANNWSARLRIQHKHNKQTMWNDLRHWTYNVLDTFCNIIFYLDQMQQRSLKLASGQNSDLFLQRVSGQGWGRRAALLGNRWQPATGLCLSENTGREEQVGGHSGWYPLGGDDLDGQGQLLVFLDSYSQWQKELLHLTTFQFFISTNISIKIKMYSNSKQVKDNYEQSSAYLKLQRSLLTCSGCGLVWDRACNLTLSGPQKSRG